MKNLALLSVAFTLVFISPLQAQAQKANTKKIDKVEWFHGRRQFQIIDERPEVHDFREAPSAPQQFDLPPGPQGFDGSGSYNGPGSMGDGGPGGGTAPIQLGGPNPGYRNAPSALQSLPKSGFGRESNIPARGLGPKGPLPGVTTGVLGKLMTPVKGQGMSAGGPKGMSGNRARAAAPAQSYSGGYGQGSGSSYGGGRTEGIVRGTLLRSK